MLTQRLAKNANLLSAAETVDPEVIFLLGRDSNTLNELVDQLGKMKQRRGYSREGQTTKALR